MSSNMTQTTQQHQHCNMDSPMNNWICSLLLPCCFDLLISHRSQLLDFVRDVRNVWDSRDSRNSLERVQRKESSVQFCLFFSSTFVIIHISHSFTQTQPRLIWLYGYFGHLMSFFFPSSLCVSKSWWYKETYKASSIALIILTSPFFFTIILLISWYPDTLIAERNLLSRILHFSSIMSSFQLSFFLCCYSTQVVALFSFLFFVLKGLEQNCRLI